MKNKVKITNNKVVNIVKETLKRDGFFVTDSKIDSIIKKYLIEREDLLLDDESHIQDSYRFSDESKNVFNDTTNILNKIIEDFGIIKIKEGDVLVHDNFYSDECIENIMSDLENIIERVEYLKGLE